MKDGMVVEDIVCEKITGKNSPKVQECNKQMRGFLKRQKEYCRFVAGEFRLLIKLK